MKKLTGLLSFILLANLTLTSCNSDDNNSINLTPIAIEKSTGTYLGNVGNKGSFKIVLNTNKGDFHLDFISSLVAEEDLLEATLEPKTYLFSEGALLYTFTSKSFLKQGDTQFKLVGGEITVTKNEKLYTFKGQIKDEQGLTYDLNYTNALDIEPIYDTNYEIQNGWYWGDDVFEHPNVAEYMTFFTQGEANRYGELEGDGYHISLSMFDAMAPKAWEAKIPNKTFKAASEFKVGSFKVGTKEAIESGEIDYSFATFQHNDKAAGIKEELYILDGSIKVMENSQGQEVRFNILLQNGKRHLGKYVGKVKQGDQYTISTLRADKEVGPLTQGFLEYKGKSPITEKQNNRWNIYLYAETVTPHPGDYFWAEGSGEWMRVTIYSEVNATTDIPVGEFPIGDETAGNAGSGGGTEPGLDWGTWYFSMDDDETTSFAPTRTGTVKIAKTGDQYTVSLNAIDDRENKITASYTGALAFVNNASRTTANATAKTVKKSYNKGKKFDAAKNSRK